MKPRLEACYFGTGDHGARYERLARVLEHTAQEHCPDWDIRVERLAQGGPGAVPSRQRQRLPRLEHVEARALAASHR